MQNYPNWFWTAVQELEQDLADGHMGHSQFNKAMEELEQELLEEEMGTEQPY